MDRLYPQDNGESAVQPLMKQLAEPRPFDLDSTDLAEYRDLELRWQDWRAVVKQCQAVSVALMDEAAGG